MRLERIGEGSALIARIEAINVAAFPEIERISIKNFLKMSRKGQLEIAAIFEDFTAQKFMRVEAGSRRSEPKS